MSILICGGAGYIGSHATKALRELNEELVVADNLLTGFAESLPIGVNFHQVDIRDKVKLKEIMRAHKVTEVIHFAASSQVGQSMKKPLMYFDNNVYGTLSLLEAMAETNVNIIVFSSSAAVYGEPMTTPIFEDFPLAPTSPYGESKAIMEKMMRWAAAAHPIRFISLRYFNVAGAIEDGSIGEAHAPETHLIPIVLSAALGQRENITVFGDDYDTKDGTCIRDYVHVEDLVDAHILALKRLRAGGESDIFNLGSESGFSVMEIISAAESVVGKAIPHVFGARRGGDPDRLVASSAKAQKILGWKPKRSALKDIISSAWRWHKNHPYGYNKENISLKTYD